MTKEQRLQKAKEQSLKKWENIYSESENGESPNIGDRCGFCKQYNMECESCCPVGIAEKDWCDDTKWWYDLMYYVDNDPALFRQWVLAIMIYIHGFEV